MIALARLVYAHRGAFEHDWRARFGSALSDVGETMSWGEAVRLTEILMADPSSQVAASVNGWDHAIDRTSLALYSLFDLVHEVAWSFGGRKGRRPKPHPRPWPDLGSRQAKPADSLTQADVLAALRSAGHTAPVPTA